MSKENNILTKANILLAIDNGATDEEIYALSEGFIENRLEELINTIKISVLDHKVDFIADFLSEKYPERKQFLLLNAIQLSGNFNSKAQTEELISKYRTEYGDNFEILVEMLTYYMNYSPRNIKRIKEIYDLAISKQEEV